MKVKNKFEVWKARKIPKKREIDLKPMSWSNYKKIRDEERNATIRELKSDVKAIIPTKERYLEHLRSLVRQGFIISARKGRSSYNKFCKKKDIILLRELKKGGD